MSVLVIMIFLASEHLGIFRVNDIVVVLNVEFSWG